MWDCWGAGSFRFAGTARQNVASQYQEPPMALFRCVSLARSRLAILAGILSAVPFFQNVVAAANKSINATPKAVPHVALDLDAIPPGTIIPIRLGSLSSEKTKPGARIKARIMQDVPLGNGAKVRAGSSVLGQVVAATPAAPGTNATLALKFDTVVQGKQFIPVVTHVRAMASRLEVQFAETPPIGPGETDVYDWLSTVQVGGDRVVGHSVYDGILAQPNAQEGRKCSGPMEGNDSLQPFWVFSSDACGLYGFPGLAIGHAGRTPPRGEIVLVSEHGPVKIRSGSGMLLRVQR
jgi:hypothetical protein